MHVFLFRASHQETCLLSKASHASDIFTPGHCPQPDKMPAFAMQMAAEHAEEVIRTANYQQVTTRRLAIM